MGFSSTADAASAGADMASVRGRSDAPPSFVTYF